MARRMTRRADWIDDLAERLPELSTTDEAAQLLRLDRRTVYRLLDAGQIAMIRRGRRRLIPRIAIVDYLRAQAG
jgi:excisionase family DNA binding protein